MHCAPQTDHVSYDYQQTSDAYIISINIEL